MGNGLTRVADKGVLVMAMAVMNWGALIFPLTHVEMHGQEELGLSRSM